MELEAMRDTAEQLVNSLQPENVEGYTIALGHAFDQITLHGHFDTFEEAVEAVETFERNYGWHIVPLWKMP